MSKKKKQNLRKIVRKATKQLKGGFDALGLLGDPESLKALDKLRKRAGQISVKREYFVVATDPSNKGSFIAIKINAKSPENAFDEACKRFNPNAGLTHLQIFSCHSDYFKGKKPLLEKDIPAKGKK